MEEQITEPTLEFKKMSILKGIPKELEGYYFKGEFISRYKTETTKLLRERIGKLSDEEAKKTDEWKVLHEIYLFGRLRAEKTEIAKKEYYKMRKEESIKNKIAKLECQLNYLKNLKNEQ
jgi:hypothetical protein